MQGQPTSWGLRRNTNSVIITPFEKFKIICVDQIRASPAPIASPGIHWSDFGSLCQQSIQTGGDPNLFVRIILGCDPDIGVPQGAGGSKNPHAVGDDGTAFLPQFVEFFPGRDALSGQPGLKRFKIGHREKVGPEKPSSHQLASATQRATSEALYLIIRELNRIGLSRPLASAR